MGLIGFILLLVGGGLLIVSGQSIALDPATAALFAGFLNTILGAPNGDFLVSLLVTATSLGGIVVIIGALIWYAAGSGILALIGRIIVTVATFTAFYFVAMKIIEAWTLGIFSQPIHVIIAYFASLGLGFTSVVLILIGDFIGAGRKKKEEVSEETESA